MSIQIDWQRLLEDANKVETKLKQFLDDQFQRVNLPPFIQSLSVSSFKLGDVPPEITIRHISDPFPEFYEDYDETSDAEADDKDLSRRTSTVSSTHPLQHPPKLSRLNSTHLMSPVRELPTKPFNRSSTPSGSLNYYHLNSTDELPELSSLEPEDSVLQGLDQEGELSDEGMEYLPQEGEEDHAEHPSPLDVQLFVEFAYNGDTQLGITATLLVNYPAPGFISLPLEFKITGIEIHTLAVIAYVKKKVYFSILCDVDENDQMSSENVKVIKQLNTESKIGDHGDNGAVLRNVSKVEQFILEQLRHVLRDELVWPGWITLEL